MSDKKTRGETLVRLEEAARFMAGARTHLDNAIIEAAAADVPIPVILKTAHISRSTYYRTVGRAGDTPADVQNAT